MTRARVDITAEDRTQAAFRSASARIRSFASTTAASAGAVAAVGGAYLEATRRASAYADGIAKSIRNSGLAASTFQALKFQASEAGVGYETLNGSLVRFQKRLGLAAQGTGAAVAEYKRLGISVTDSEGRLRSTEDVLREVTDTIAGMDSQTERVAATTRFFGDDAAKLESVMRGGSAQMDAYKDRARELGLVIGNETLLAAEEANDQFSLMSEVIRTRTTVALVQLAPVVDRLSESFLSVVNTMSPVLDLLSQSEAATLRTSRRFAEFSLTMLRLRASLPWADVEQLNASMLDQEAIVASVNRRLAELAERQAAATVGLGDLTLDGRGALTPGGQISIGEATDTGTPEAARSADLERQREFLGKREKIRAAHEARMAAITSEGSRKRLTLEKQAQAMSYSTLVGSFAQMTAGLAQHNKAVFKMNQVAAIANAIINTRQGITEALKLPPPKSFVLAGLVAAKGFAEVAAIRSQTFSGGGGGTTPSAVGSGAVVNGNPVPSDVGTFQDAGRPREGRIEVQIDGGAISAESARELAERIGEAYEDGVDARFVLRGF